MEDAKVFGSFSVLMGVLIIVLSSFLNAIPLFMIIGILTGVGIFLCGAFVLFGCLSGRNCPVCGEVLRDENGECIVCGHQLPVDVSFPLLQRFFRREDGLKARLRR